MPTSDAAGRAAAAAGLWGGAAVSVTPLAGDASTRAYFRARSGGRSAVIAVHDAAFDEAGFPFLETTALLDAAGLPVARVLAVHGSAGVLVLEDLGDQLLQGLVAAGDPRVPGLYELAVDLMLRLQRDGTPRVHGGLHAGREILDAARFRYELDFFFEHLVLGLRGQRPQAGARRAWETARDRLCAALEAAPRVLCHRDYHSRNLMVTAAGLAVVDHQDARLGPHTYDLASLLFDPYVSLPDGLVTRLADRALAGRAAGESPAVFREHLDMAAAQRLLKAAGTFAAQKRLHGRDGYLPYLDPALRRAAAALARLPQHADLAAALGGLLPEPA